MRTTSKDFDIKPVDSASNSTLNQNIGNHFYYGKSGRFGGVKHQKTIRTFEIEDVENEMNQNLNQGST